MACKYCNSFIQYKGEYEWLSLSDDMRSELLSKWKQEDIDNGTFNEKLYAMRKEDNNDTNIINYDKNEPTSVSLKIQKLSDIVFIFNLILGILIIFSGIIFMFINWAIALILLLGGIINIFIGSVLKIVLNGYSIIVKNSEQAIEERKK
jgi:hypothetical protein